MRWGMTARTKINTPNPDAAKCAALRMGIC